MRDGESRRNGGRGVSRRPSAVDGSRWTWGRAATDQGQWTVVKRRLAARSSSNRPSCQGVRWLNRVSPCT